jgi:hypothetical protein
MRAASSDSVGDLGLGGVKLFTAYAGTLKPAVIGGGAVIGGAAFDHPVSPNTHGGPRKNLQTEGCPTYNYPNQLQTCDQLTTEAAAYNVLATFFDETPGYWDFNKILDRTTKDALVHKRAGGDRAIQFLDVSFQDVQYASANWCPPTPRNTTLGLMSLQDLLNRASYDLLTLGGVKGLTPPLPTCP